MSQTVVLGSNGFLGQSISQLLTGKRILTHRRTPKFPDSLRYDFFADEALPITLDEPSTIIFTAGAHMNQPTPKVAAAMTRLLERVAGYRFVYISSDALFDGTQGNYTEDDTPNPVAEYGHNLLTCERTVQAMCADYCIIRPSYIYGFVNGELDRRLAQTRDTLLSGEGFTAFVDMFKSPLSYQEEALAVVQLAASNFVGTIHVAGPRMSAYEFRLRAMQALGVDCTHLRPESMPDNREIMRDTSLDSTKWQALLNASPISIEEGLAY